LAEQKQSIASRFQKISIPFINIDTVVIIATNCLLEQSKNCCPQGMQFFLAQVGQGKDTVCAYLHMSAVNKLNFR
jgi:hypothetical protein